MLPSGRLGPGRRNPRVCQKGFDPQLPESAETGLPARAHATNSRTVAGEMDKKSRMIADRGLLDGVAGDALAGKEVKIETDRGEVRVYKLRRLIGKGKAGVAWEAVDTLDR